ncbi:MAG: glycogen/starch synthase [Proteobacteria bacterium]|nr:glycogen/starch synthase [Pseudomonadota bacterium]MBU4068428.1 glycogen/starch synthase [Pseudomonadota bacterium]MBU4100313.1 glycogen/starch synthase [Pseudomonadota bacterium]MBU4126344.1 glycogen/starch synthase [Pseudomonadota bacterium]
MKKASANPRILIVTPEVTYLPQGMGNVANYLVAKAGGLADVSAALISALFDQGADVHVAIPDYREIFNAQNALILGKELNTIRKKMPNERIHLAEDRAFFYIDRIYSGYEWENSKIALAFQREVINNIIPNVQPDLIHCNDWMTGLIPAMARQLGIPCLFTVHNIYTVNSPLFDIEDKGIDAASFWQYLFYDYCSGSYEATRGSSIIDFLASGIFAAHFVNTVSPTFLKEVVDGLHYFIEGRLQRELANKFYAGCAAGILNAPDPSFNPSTDEALVSQYTSKNHYIGKQENKRSIQKMLGLIQDVNAPIFFWPSRLDTVQKGCQLLSDILYHVVSLFWEQNLEIIFVANGEFQRHFRDIVNFHGLHQRVAICDFDERLARIAYGASDFVLMPSRFEPCGLPQMIGLLYGSLPVAHDTGGIHDTVVHMDVDNDTGNGFLFKTFDSNGLLWAIKQAMLFYNLPQKIKKQKIEKAMTESIASFNHAVTARKYIDLYEKMLKRPLIN